MNNGTHRTQNAQRIKEAGSDTCVKRACIILAAATVRAFNHSNPGEDGVGPQPSPYAEANTHPWVAQAGCGGWLSLRRSRPKRCDGMGVRVALERNEQSRAVVVAAAFAAAHVEAPRPQ
eukprot:CAMPEP_0119339574 /NCGR_PEP_ID=MMETSP1333-20130426/98528_1 /TAXON_ID=418940 /ORGANISM="Scyphosphaera apsteinii, Strain RCC1455" /LENGTH=118 /DNA_ID=CAMNT_0007351117 /DNA_START=220 /DNA_END=577 /DNA_ORIENTATION=-